MKESTTEIRKVTLLMDAKGIVHTFPNRIDAIEALASTNYFELTKEEMANLKAEGKVATEGPSDPLNIVKINPVVENSVKKGPEGSLTLPEEVYLDINSNTENLRVIRSCAGEETVEEGITSREDTVEGASEKLELPL